MKHLNSTTRIFVALLIVTLALTYIALVLSRKQNYHSYSELPKLKDEKVNNDAAPSKMVDTKGWVEYKDGEYPLAFSHPKNWTVSSNTTRVKGYYSIVLNPPSTNKNIYIYVANDNYLAIPGLKYRPYKIANASAVKVTDNLVGAKAGDYYYTFDASLNDTNTNEFITLLSTVKFN